MTPCSPCVLLPHVVGRVHLWRLHLVLSVALEIRCRFSLKNVQLRECLHYGQVRTQDLPGRPPLVGMGIANVACSEEHPDFRTLCRARARARGPGPAHAAAPAGPGARPAPAQCRGTVTSRSRLQSTFSIGILKYVIRTGSFLRKGIELSNTVS